MVPCSLPTVQSPNLHGQMRYGCNGIRKVEQFLFVGGAPPTLLRIPHSLHISLWMDSLKRIREIHGHLPIFGDMYCTVQLLKEIQRHEYMDL